MVAEALGHSSSEVCQALLGKRIKLAALLLQTCTDEWLAVARSAPDVSARRGQEKSCPSTTKERMAMDRLRGSLRLHNISLRVVAHALDCSLMQVYHAFIGTKPTLVPRVLALCTHLWIQSNVPKPKHLTKPLDTFSDQELHFVRRRLDVLHRSIEFGQGPECKDRWRYGEYVRTGSRLVISHLWGLMPQIDEVLDASPRTLIVEFPFSVDAGYEARVPFFTLCNPFNHQAIAVETGTPSGSVCATSVDELQERVATATRQYPRWWFLTARPLINTRLVGPTTEAERYLKRSTYRTPAGKGFEKSTTTVLWDTNTHGQK